MKNRILIIALLLLAGIQFAAAAPSTIRFQGRLTDNGGRPIAGPEVQVRFAVYNALTGGSALWETAGSHVVATNESGLFSTEIGPLPADVLASEQDLYLQVSVRNAGGFRTLSPRQKLTSVPSALRAEYAAQAGSALLVPDGSITSLKIKDGAITESKIAPGAVGAAQIKDQAVGRAKLASDTVTSTNIQDGSIQAVDLATDAVRSANIRDGSIEGTDLGSNSVGAAQIQAGAINSDHLQADSVTALHIASGTITSEEIRANSIRPENILRESLTADEIANGVIGRDRLNIPSFNAPGEGLLPAGATVLFLDRASCPAGYSEVTSLRNKIPIGADLSNADPDVPNAVAQQVGSKTHTHTINHTHNTGAPETFTSPEQIRTDEDLVSFSHPKLVSSVAGNLMVNGNDHSHRSTSQDTPNSGSTTLLPPALTVIFCQKN